MDKGFARCLVVLVLFALPLSAQINGVPASVTSYGFGGHFDPSPGIPASVTSLGPAGYGSQHTSSGRGFGFGSFPAGNQNHSGSGNNHHPGFGNQRRESNFYGGYGAVYSMPYPVYVVPEEKPPAEQFPEEEYRGGPTIFDRRGPGRSRNEVANTQPEPPMEPPREDRPEPPPAADQPETVLVFKDGHLLEVRNYAIVGDSLVDLTEGHRRKVPLTELDVEATAKQNDDRGIDFRLPAAQAN